MKQIGVGIIGFGTVGAGVVDGLQRNRELLAQRLGVEVVLKRIADLDITTVREGTEVDTTLLTTDAMALINDPAVAIVVELIGGSGIAKTLVLAALKAGKPVVTANKKLLAECGAELFTVAQQQGVDLYFGASVGGGIPIVRVLREGLVGNQIKTLYGILNGTCNYILTRMEREELSFEAVLQAAQEAGYAEADPSLDIDGFDTAHKAAILASLAYGFHVPLAAIKVEGIRHLATIDVKFAMRLGYRIKLLAAIKHLGDEVEVSVQPTLVPLDHMLAAVHQVFNAVMVEGDFSGETFYHGRGAGRAPTASTVIGDISDIARNLLSSRPRYQRGLGSQDAAPLALRPAAAMINRYYLRLMVLDRAGSVGIFTDILGRRGVSILAAMQKESPVALECTKYVPVVVLTHATREDAIDAALDDIYATGVVSERPVKLRILEHDA